MPSSNQSTLHTIVAYSPYQWEHALTTLRIVRPLAQAGLKLIHGNELSDIHPERVSLGDVVVIQREAVDNLEIYEQILERARAEHKPLIYEIDDLLLEIPEEHPDRPIDYYTPSLFSMLRAIIEADLVTTTTPVLQEYLRPFNPHIYLLPNYLDDSIWKLHPPQEKAEPYPVVIGYMGSNTHLPDLQALLPAFYHLLERYQQKIILRFWGGEPPEELRSYPSVEWIPLAIPNYTEFAEYFSSQQADIFIAPLKDSLFNRCKSPVKFLEYSSQGVPGIYSRIAPYENLVTHEVNGLLASTAEEWEGALVQLIEDPKWRFQLGQNALQTVMNNWLLSTHAQEWTAAYQMALALTADITKQQTKQETLQVIVRVASQVRSWHLKMHRQLTLRDKQIQQLQSELAQKEEEIHEIQRSRGWKLIQAAWRLRRSLIPPGSRRERFMQRLMHSRQTQDG